MGKKVEESDSLPSASEPSAIDSGKLSCGVADKVSATVAMKSGAENPGNDSSYQNQSLRLFPTIARKIRREIASGRKFRHREIPVSELPDNGYLRDFEFKKGAEREKMLSSLEFISSKINSDPSLPKKYPVVVAADSCFTNNLVVGLFEDFL